LAKTWLVKFSITAVPVMSGVQILKKFEEIFFKVILKIMQFIGRTLTAPKCKPASPNIF